MQIKKGDKWKAAFVINLGLFKPQVMFFELINSPATFQTMMNEIFATELREGWLSIYMDDILVHISQAPRMCSSSLNKTKGAQVILKAGKVPIQTGSSQISRNDPQRWHHTDGSSKGKGVVDWPFPLNVKDM